MHMMPACVQMRLCVCWYVMLPMFEELRQRHGPHKKQNMVHVLPPNVWRTEPTVSAPLGWPLADPLFQTLRGNAGPQSIWEVKRGSEWPRQCQKSWNPNFGPTCKFSKNCGPKSRTLRCMDRCPMDFLGTLVHKIWNYIQLSLVGQWLSVILWQDHAHRAKTWQTDKHLPN